MILNQSGQSVQCEKNTYSIGDRIIIQPEHPCSGLYGTIVEIRTAEDKISNANPVEIICNLMASVLPNEIAALEKKFSESRDEEMPLADIPLDAVTLETEQIRILHQDADAVELPIYILWEDWAVDGDYGMTTFITANRDEARWEMHEMVHRDMREGVLNRLLDRSDLDTDHGEDHYECWRNGCYSDDHYLADIEEVTIKLPAHLVSVLIQTKGVYDGGNSDLPR